MSLARRSGLLLLVAVLAACGKKADDKLSQDSLGADSSKAAPLALQVVGEAVRVGDLVLTVEAVGTVRTDASSSLKAEAGGTVQEVLVRAGQRVTAGQPLVRLDPKPFELALAEAKAALSSAQMSYQTEILADSIAEGRVRPERRAFMQAKAGIEGAEVRLEKAKLDRERAVITAPYAGMIERVGVAVGERIGAGTEVAMVVDLNNLRVEAQVLEHNLPLLKVGGDAFVTVAAAPTGAIKGTISAILPMVDSITKSGKAVVRIKGDGVLRPGMFANLRLEANRLPGRTIVPKRAVIERDGRPLVFVVRDGIAEWVYIQPGLSNGLETEVLPDSSSGQIPLKAGDMVLIDGHLTLTHQAPVRLVAKRETAQ